MADSELAHIPPDQGNAYGPRMAGRLENIGGDVAIGRAAIERGRGEAMEDMATRKRPLPIADDDGGV